MDQPLPRRRRWRWRRSHRLLLPRLRRLNVGTSFFLLALIECEVYFTAPTPVEDDLETHIEVVVKNPQVILLEDQRNSNSNCVVLDVSLSVSFSLEY